MGMLTSSQSSAFQLTGEGAFEAFNAGGAYRPSGSTYYDSAGRNIRIDSASVVPVGNENSPRTTITRHWRLVARGLQVSSA